MKFNLFRKRKDIADRVERIEKQLEIKNMTLADSIYSTWLFPENKTIGTEVNELKKRLSLFEGSHIRLMGYLGLENKRIEEKTVIVKIKKEKK